MEKKTPPSKKTKKDTVDLVESEEDVSMKQGGKPARKSKTSAVQYVFFFFLY